MVFAEVKEIFVCTPATTILPVSLAKELAYTQPIKSTIVAAEISISPVD